MKNQTINLTTKPETWVAPGSQAGLSFADALASPCATCATSSCCRNVPLHTFEVGDLMAVDHARYLLNFDGIELGIASDGTWNVLYQVPCRHLDLDTFDCTVHDQPEQPSICVNYNPYACWYRSSLEDMTNPDHLRVDRTRFEALLPLLEFDDDRRIVAGPEWAEIEELFSTIPVVEPELRHQVAAEPVFEQWVEVVLGRRSTPERDRTVYDGRDPEITAPCHGCSAPCCSTLIFPLDVPTTTSAVDYIHFLLGFAGLEIGVADGGWAVVVQTRCRHLTDDARCGVYGSDDRPLLCRYYDEHSCTYKPQFAEPRPDHFLRVRHEQYEAFAECFQFDAEGTVVAVADTATMRHNIEARMVETATEAASA